MNTFKPRFMFDSELLSAPFVFCGFFSMKSCTVSLNRNISQSADIYNGAPLQTLTDILPRPYRRK